MYNHPYPSYFSPYEEKRMESRETPRRGRSHEPYDYVPKKPIISREPDFLRRTRPLIALPSTNIFSPNYDPTRFRRYKRDRTPRNNSPTFQSSVFNTEEDEDVREAPVPKNSRANSRHMNSRSVIKERPNPEPVLGFRRTASPYVNLAQSADVVPFQKESIEKSKTLDENAYGAILPSRREEFVPRLTHNSPEEPRGREKTPVIYVYDKGLYYQQNSDNSETPKRIFRKTNRPPESRSSSPIAVSSFPREKYQKIKKRLFEIRNIALPEDEVTFRRKAEFYFKRKRIANIRQPGSSERSFDEALEARLLAEMNEVYIL